MKGISPLIAAVLLIAFTLGIAGIAGPYMTELMQQSTQGQEEEAQKLIQASKANLEILHTSYNSTEEKAEITFQNTGSVPIEEYSITVFGDDSNQTSKNSTLEKRAIRTVDIKTSSTPERVQVAAENMPVTAEKRGDNLFTASTIRQTSLSTEILLLLAKIAFL